MTEKEYIVLLGFNSVQDGIDYMQSSSRSFAFSVGGSTYDYEGNSISTPTDYSVINEGDIYIGELESQFPGPGDLYVEGGFLKYFKEIA